jgi:hypothetical protein
MLCLSLLVCAVRVVIQAKWHLYGRRLVLQEAALHVLLLALFAVFCLLLPECFSHYAAGTSSGNAYAVRWFHTGSKRPLVAAALLLAAMDAVALR